MSTITARRALASLSAKSTAASHAITPSSTAAASKNSRNHGGCLSDVALRSNNSKFWNGISQAPADPILGIIEEFAKSSSPQRVNLSVGAYRDNNGLPYVLPSIRMASAIVYQQKLDEEYAPIVGTANYVSLVKKFLYGSFSTGADLIKEDRIAMAQSISGTGALKLVADFLKKWSPYESRAIYLSNPTWANHANIFGSSGIEPRQYTYFNRDTNAIDMELLLDDLSNAERGSAVLLHACCHNPTGLDPTEEQWRDIVDVISQRELIPVVDIAYQGFQSGHLSQDLYLLKLVSEKCTEGLLPTAFVCQSFAKNMGLYGERVGSVSLITPSKEVTNNVDSQMKTIVRSIYSSPPVHGSRLVETVLSDESIFAQWNKDVQLMANRIKSMRQELHGYLTRHSDLNWDHIVEQNGMFCYTGLNKDQMTHLKDDFHVYATMDGRFSMAGLNTSNVEYVANAMDKVTR